MAAPVNSEARFTGAVTGAVVNKAICSSKKCLSKFTVAGFAPVKLEERLYWFLLVSGRKARPLKHQ